MQLQSINDVLMHELKDLYSAEQQLSRRCRDGSAASSTELREAFEHHLEETRGHVTRLQEILGQLGDPAPSSTARGWKVSSPRAARS